MSASAIWNPPLQPSRERMFNVPFVVLAMGALVGLVHALIALLLSEDQTNEFLLVFAFIPGRYDAGVLAGELWTTGWGAAVWTFVTYAFIHSDLNHLFFNLVWLLAFGTAVARRFGAPRFIAFFIATAAAGAAAHLVTHWGELVPMVGASAAISGAMGAVLRFVFGSGGQLNVLASRAGELHRAPAMPLALMLRNRRVLFILLMSIGVYALFGLRIFALPGIEQSIAWEAHVGGFLAGLLAFTLFDPADNSAAPPLVDAPSVADAPSNEPTPQ
jgi:membrane associated rhomboid family serine protease